MRITPISLTGCGSDGITLNPDMPITSAIEIGGSTALANGDEFVVSVVTSIDALTRL
jgi:hypothetical protein